MDGKLFANFFAPFHASADGYFAIFTEKDDLNGRISFKSISNLSLIPGKQANEPVTKIFETNLCWMQDENFFSIKSMVSDSSEAPDSEVLGKPLNPILPLPPEILEPYVC